MIKVPMIDDYNWWPSTGLWVVILVCYLPAAIVVQLVWPELSPVRFVVRMMIVGTVFAVVCGLVGWKSRD